MRKFLLYTLGLFVLLFVVIFYFLKMDMGHKHLGYFIEDYLSVHTYNKIEVDSLNLENYPVVEMELQVNDTANLRLKGKLDNYTIDMVYQLKGEALRFNDFYLNDKIDVNGTLIGAFSALEVKGEGEIFDGRIDYSFINIPHKIKDLQVEMNEVNVTKILTFLERKDRVYGRADIEANFDYFSKYSKEGRTKIKIKKLYFPQIEENLPLVLNSVINFEGVEYRYGLKISSPIGSFLLKNGYYHDGKKIVKGEYELSVKALKYFEKRLKHRYEGGLDINGTVFYDNNEQIMKITGATKQFGGVLSYLYKNETIDVTLKEVSLKRILHQLSYPVLFLSKIDGTIHMDLRENRIIVNTDLKNTRFVPSELSDTLYKKASIDILSEVYDNSSFSAGYQNAVLSSTLKIDNGQNHLYLTDTLLNVVNSEIESKFEIKMQGEKILGEIHGTLDETRIWIDKEKFIEYKTNKYLSDWLRTSK